MIYIYVNNFSLEWEYILHQSVQDVLLKFVRVTWSAGIVRHGVNRL
jgi:hypothetical protein